MAMVSVVHAIKVLKIGGKISNGLVYLEFGYLMTVIETRYRTHPDLIVQKPSSGSDTP